MDPSFSWIYLIFFLAIPLARIIPRIIARRRMTNPDERFQNNFEYREEKISETREEKISETREEKIPETREEKISETREENTKPKTKSMMVLGELNNGTRTFEKVQKNTGLDSEELNKILENLEKQGLLKVQQKQGLFGLKVELYPTEKGFKEYYS